MADFSHVIEFYGETCPHCVTMGPIVDEVNEALGGEIKRLEVWEHPENEAIMKQYSELIEMACGGFAAVPSFVNTQTKQALCGVQDKETLLALAQGADCKDNVCQIHSKMPDKPEAAK